MSNLHVIIGEDDYLVGEAAKRIVGDGVGLEVVDSINSTNAELQLRDLREAETSFLTPPFLEPKKVTWWKNVHFLPGGGKRAPAEEVKEALATFVGKLVASPLPENQHFILSGPHLLKTSVVAKRLSTAAEVLAFGDEKPWEAARNAEVRVIDCAKEMGLSFAPGVSGKFVARVGTDMRSLVSELGKLRDYLGPESSTVTAAAVEEISSPGIVEDPVPWEVTDAIGRRQLEAALAAIRRFELETGFGVFMSGIVERFFRQLLDVAAGRTDGMSPFALKKNREFLRNWTLPEIRAARARFFRLREQAVSGSGCVGTLIVTTLVRVMRRSARR